jgi:hypothetical protein
LVVRERVGVSSLAIKLLSGHVCYALFPDGRAVILALLPLVFSDFVAAHFAEGMGKLHVNLVATSLRMALLVFDV